MNRILLVDDEVHNLKALQRSLKDEYEVVLLSSPLQALEYIEKEQCAVILSDQRMPEMLGTEFLAKAAQLQPEATRILLTAYSETDEILEAINKAHIYRYLLKPWEIADLKLAVRDGVDRSLLRRRNAELFQALEHTNRTLRQKEQELVRLNRSLESQVRTRTLELEAANTRLQELATTDSLTGVMNRRAFEEALKEEIQRASRYHRNLTIAMVDVDHFKKINDDLGHGEGDKVLQWIAETLKRGIRKTDRLARWGGEEFVILFPETSASIASETCERIRAGLQASGGNQVTVSIGLATFPAPAKDLATLLLLADQALYSAKNAGRNRVVLHGTLVS